MSKVITIGKRLLSSEQVALVEVFDPTTNNPDFKPDKDFKGRVMLLDRDTVLTEQTPQDFAEEHGLHLLNEENVALNRSINFKVEAFAPSEGYNPGRDFKTRLKWRDLSGNEQSKLLLTPPETVIAEILGHKSPSAQTAKRPARRPARGRSGSRRMEAFRS